MQVSVPRDAVVTLTLYPALKEVLLVVPGNLSELEDIRRMRKRIWCLARRRGVLPISTTMAWRSTRYAITGEEVSSQTAFRVARCAPVPKLSSSQQAEIFLAVRVSGMTRRQAAEKYGVSSSAACRVVTRLSRVMAA